MTTITAEDWAAAGLSEHANNGRFATEITADDWTLFDPEPTPYSVVGTSHPWTRDDG